MSDLYLVVGLGNPGLKYADTRHNMGFKTIDALAARSGVKVKKLKCKALIGEWDLEGQKVLLAKPQTFMNLSGESVRDLVEYYGISLERLIVIYDDIDIPLGRIRVRLKGSAGSHNGMKSIIYLLESEEFPRVRIGIGKPPEDVDLVQYVLEEFQGDELKIALKSVDLAADAVIEIIRSGVERAMSFFNPKSLED